MTHSGRIIGGGVCDDSGCPECGDHIPAYPPGTPGNPSVLGEGSPLLRALGLTIHHTREEVYGGDPGVHTRVEVILPGKRRSIALEFWRSTAM